MPSAADFLDAAPPKPKQSAADFLGTDLPPAPKAAPTPKPAVQPKPSAVSFLDKAKTVYGDMAARYPGKLAERSRQADEQMATGAKGPDDLAGAAMGPLNLVGGAFAKVAAPITAGIDVLAGRPLAEATKNAPAGKHYDLRVPEGFVGDSALAVSGFMGGKPQLKGARAAGDVAEYEAFKPTKAEAAAAKKAPPPGLEPVAELPKAPSAAEFLDRGKGNKTATRAAKFDAPAAVKSAEAFLDEDVPPKPQRAAAAAAVQQADREIVAPGHVGEGGPVVGDEAHPVERVDNALYRLGGHATADKIEAQQFLKSLPKEVADPKVQEEVYHAIEAKLTDPGATIPEGLRPAFDAFKPYYEEQTAIINRLRERSDPSIEPYLEDQGYVARRAQGHSPLFDAALDPSERPRDPILGGKSLFKTTTAQKARTAGFVTTDQAGQQHFWKGAPPETDLKGRPYADVRQATTREIEANSDTRYHKNALVNTVDNVLRLRRVERNLDVLDEITTNLKDEGLAHRSEWTYRDPETGQTILQRANSQAPEGFVELPHVPQLRGWKFDPHVAEALKDYYPGPEEPLDSVIAKVNRGLTASLFITPVPHAANVMNHWIVGRGWDWMTPGGYKRLAQTGARATKEVLTMGPAYKRLMREGSGLLYGDTQTRDFYKTMLEKAGGEMLDDPKAVSIFAKAAGVPVDAVKGLYNWSNKALWAANDVFMLQRQLELEAKGMSARKAIKEAERDIPNYRIPPQIMKSRAFAQFMKSPNYLLFGRYKYGQMKAWGEMFKDLLGPKATPAERADAVGKFLVVAIMSMGVYPLADMALRKATGNDEAEVHRAGGFSMSNAITDLSTGQKDFATAMSSFMSPAPVPAKLLGEIPRNRDFFGRPIVEDQSTPLGKVVQAGEYAASSAAYPAGLGLEALKPGGVPRAAGKLVGLDLPPEGKEGKRHKAQGYARKKAMRREAKDPVERAIKGVLP